MPLGSETNNYQRATINEITNNQQRATINNIETGYPKIHRANVNDQQTTINKQRK